MSKIRIYGDTSGYIDVAAPATADNSTLDLSTVAKTNSANTFSNPVTITSDIDETSQYNGQLVINSQTKATGEYARVLFQHSDHGSASIASDYESSGYGNLIFSTRGGGNPTERMRIDASGRVTMPYQPAFVASANANQTTNYWDGFTDYPINRGNHFDPSTGIFTAPVAGVYFFSFGTIGTQGHADTDVFLYVNGAKRHDFVGSRPDDSGTWASLNPGVGLAYLNANDQARVYAVRSDVYSDSNLWCKFCGYLVG